METWGRGRSYGSESMSCAGLARCAWIKRLNRTYRVIGVGPLGGHNGRARVGSHGLEMGLSLCRSKFGSWREKATNRLWFSVSRAGVLSLPIIVVITTRVLSLFDALLSRSSTRHHLDFIMTASPEPAGSPHDVNDLFDYDVGLDEIFQGTNTSNDTSNAPKPAGDPSSLGLGLDEEVKVTKKRQPVAKLDEGRLLSQPGIPKLRRAAKQKLKFKGRGHEVGDWIDVLMRPQLIAMAHSFPTPRAY